ncbi:MAG: hypothetical protein JNK15_21625 [Planctomycetes bacterium]|nr:hypothetical protein [Planctomycetota bacterium]
MANAPDLWLLFGIGLALLLLARCHRLPSRLRRHRAKGDRAPLPDAP